MRNNLPSDLVFIYNDNYGILSLKVQIIVDNISEMVVKWNPYRTIYNIINE